MVRTVNKQGGFSFVEILVSMVLLSIVVLLMSNVLITSTKSQGAAKSDDMGDMLALQKLAELQNGVIPAQSSATALDTLVDHITYSIEWVLTNTANLPARADVTVSWTGVNGTSETSSMTGYMNSDNSCPELPTGVSNTGPSNLKFKGPDGSDLTTFGTINFPITTGANSVMATFTADDAQADLTPSKDILSYLLDKTTGDYSEFYIDGNALKNVNPFATVTANTSYTVKVIVTDCHGLTAPANLTVVVVAAAIAPIITMPASEDIAENSPSGTDVLTTGQLSATANGAPIDWEISSSEFVIEGTVADDGATATIKVADGADLDYEQRTEVEVTVTATNRNESFRSTSKVLLVNITNLDEKPTGVTFTTLPLRLAPTGGPLDISEFSIIDIDGGTYNLSIWDTTATSSQVTQFTTSQIVGHTDRYMLKSSIATLNVGDTTVTLKIEDTDAAGTDKTFTKDITISVYSSTVGCGGLTEYSLVTANPTSKVLYTDGEYTKYKGIKYEATKDTDNGSGYPGSTHRYFDYVGVCN